MHRANSTTSENGHRDNPVTIGRRHHNWLEAENLVVRRTANGYEARPRDGPSP